MGMALQRSEQAINNLVPCTPNDMPSWNRIARPVDSPLRPIDHGQELDSLGSQKLKNVFARILTIEPSPSPGPLIIRLVAGDTLPVPPSEFRRVANPKPALMRCVDHVHSTK